MYSFSPYPTRLDAFDGDLPPLPPLPTRQLLNSSGIIIFTTREYYKCNSFPDPFNLPNPPSPNNHTSTTSQWIKTIVPTLSTQGLLADGEVVKHEKLIPQSKRGILPPSGLSPVGFSS